MVKPNPGAASVAAVVALSISGSLAANTALADTVTTMDVLDKPNIVVNGDQTNLFSFSAPGMGDLSVKLTDVVWPEPLHELNVSILSPLSALGEVSSSKGQVFVGQAGLFYALVTSAPGTTTGLDLGMFSLQIGFTPATAPVPLPSAIALILTGLGLIGGVRLVWSRIPRALAPEPSAVGA